AQQDRPSATCTPRPNHRVAPRRASRAVVQVDPPSVERSTFDPAPTYTADPATQTESPSSGFMDVHVSPPSAVRTSLPWIDGTAPFALEAIPQPSAGLKQSTVRSNLRDAAPAKPAAAIANEAAATARRRQGRGGPGGTGLGRAGAFALASAASHMGGASNRSTSLKRSRRSSIAGSQLLAQALAGPEQVHA